MGIPHLKRNLEPYAERGPIEPCDVVVDGPALAYHVLSLASRTTIKTTPFEQPSYELLGRTALAWLEKMEECGLTVSHIYFDGFLPTSKRPERMQRLIRSTKELFKYHSTSVTGVPRERSRHTDDKKVELFPTSIGGETRAKPPPPAFLVPAVIDALRASKYGPITSVMGGEADGFCADHVRESGGLVLTSDSDLLVHDLGENGGVIFFTDIDINSEAKKLVAPQFRHAEICRKLSIKSDVGFSYMAFEIYTDPHLSLEQAAERSRRGEAVMFNREEYDTFIKTYLTPEMSPETTASGDSSLDPRVSELALRFSQISTTKSREKDASLEMFLPFLLDCPSRTSAWEASKSIRELAYSFLPSDQRFSIKTISEMRRLQTLSSGSQVDILAPVRVEEECNHLLHSINEIKATIADPELLWIALSIYLDIVGTVERAKGYPLSLEILAQEARGKLNQYFWDFLQVFAQVEATLYSLRMLQQLLGLQERKGKAVEVIGALSDLPSLNNFPSVASFAETLRRLRESGGLKCLISLCSDMEDMIPHIEAIGKSPKSKKDRKRKAQSGTVEGHQVRARPSNPFELLNSRDD
ncbi:XPG domain containing-domain-containing protein [Triangularia verruculosa]|uniref:XPG domain containing-domain-containing protein n=1 Tax=Triangularia verruculosa TaxID=2587418 RepID=A0AAN7AWR1_9PEZI|nr:XPG domain containing-domain-containing protein [Triangularia verruculosa]